MIKTIWMYVAVVAIVGAVGGGAYFYSHPTTSIQASEPSLPALAPSTGVVTSENDDEVKRKTLEGIGSIKKLKPVPIAPAQR
jgi:hypothetical protein